MRGPHTVTHRIAVFALAGALGLLSPAIGRAAKSDIALVVNKSNPVNNLSSAELRRIFLGGQTRWPTSGKITILLLAPRSDERKRFLANLLKMTDDDFTRHWISRVFQGEATSGPKTAFSSASMVRLVSEVPSALGLLSKDDVPADNPDLKILRIDGKAPGEAGYRFGHEDQGALEKHGTSVEG